MADGREQAPLSIAWRDWIAGPEWKDGRYVGPAFDAIVVGSGYGGSVAALRLAQRHYRVLLLERGSEYLPGEFPNDASLLPKYLRANIPGLGLPGGRASGLVEVHAGQGLVAVTGNGLGGGSLINAGVAVEPDAEVLAQPQWPAAIRHGLDGGLGPYFERARAELGAQAWLEDEASGGERAKTRALRRAGQRMGGRFTHVELTIDPGACTRCGDCASGCNVPGAKRTLAGTYLRQAEATGRVRVVTQAEVYRFDHELAPAPGASDPAVHQGWAVEVFATDAQHQCTATREVFADRSPAATHRRLAAPLLFLCAGAFGSTRLMQRSQARSEGRLAFSTLLGQRVSGNGDALSWLVDEPEPVSTLGRGEAGAENWRQVRQGGGDPRQVVGPTITGAVRLGEAGPLQQRVLVEDGAVPRALAPLYRELLATADVLRQLDCWTFRRPPAAGAQRPDPLGASEQRAQHAQVLLAMGHDGSPARLVWMDAEDTGAPWWPDPQDNGAYRAQQRLYDRFGARHVHNPLWRLLPQSAQELMSGPLPPQTATTVHPLGGCVMGDHPDEGVVNEAGQVWVREPGAPQRVRSAIRPGRGDPPPGVPPNRSGPHVYEGLYVLDGAIVPTALGCNPLLTITALAERAMDAILCSDGPLRTRVRPMAPQAQPPAGPSHPAPVPRRPQAWPSRDVAIDARLHEDLRADALALRRGMGGPARTVAARLAVDFTPDDLAAVLAHARHPLPLQATLWIGGRDAQGRRSGRAEAVYEARDGRLEVLPAGRLGAGRAPLVLALLQAVPSCLLVLAAVLQLGLLPVTAVLLGLPAWLALAANLLALPLLLVLPFPRSVFTWLVLRGWLDIRDGLRAGGGLGLGQWPRWALSLLRQMVHAGEKRVMRYHATFELARCCDPATGQARAREGWPARLVLKARKRVAYRASLRQLWDWAWRREHVLPDGTRERVPLRPTFWEQAMDAEVRLCDPAGRRLGAGVFRMGFDNLISSGLSSGRRHARSVLELGRRGDGTTGLLVAAGYPLLFLRFALKTRLLDFRLPAYSCVPVADRAPCASDPGLRRPGGSRVPAQVHWIEVPRGASSGDTGTESTGPLRLQLCRYRAGAEGPQVRQGRWRGVPVARVRSVLLLHAFGQSGLSYTHETTAQNLAERFHQEGWEVWILESRMSTRSGHAGEPCTVDQVAAHDVPGAVRYIVEQLRGELDARQVAPGLPVQIAAFGQCIGAAALWMALLSGRLAHPGPPSRPDGQPQLSMLSHAMTSQVHPLVVGSPLAQSKTWMPALLQALCRRGAVPFAVRGPQDGVLMPVLDRILASLPAPRAERQGAGAHDDASATCRRIRFIEAPLFRHANLAPATVAQMNLLFGEANLRLFAQASRFIERERLVDEDGFNVYVTDENLQRHCAFPIQLLHGTHNELFDRLGASWSFRRLGQVLGGWQRAFGLQDVLWAEGYGHLDVLVGQRAHEEVFPGVLDFYDRVWEREAHDAAASGPASPPLDLRPPRVGPFVGRAQRRDGRPVVRLSLLLDDTGGSSATEAPPMLLLYRRQGERRYTPLRGVRWWRRQLRRVPGRSVSAVYADVVLPPHAEQIDRWRVFSVRRHPGLPAVADGAANAADALTDEQVQRALAALEPPQAGEPVVPPLAVPAATLAQAEFRIPAATLASLDAGREVTLAASCCRYPGLGLDRGRVDAAVRALFRDGQLPGVAFGLLLGDQIYADATAGLVDASSPLERYFQSHEAAFGRSGAPLDAQQLASSGSLGDLLASLPVYMTPDDHEWVEAWPAGGPLVREPWADGRDPACQMRQRRAFQVADEALTAFQRLQLGGGRRVPKRFAAVRHGSVRLALLDTRLSRRRGVPSILHPAAFRQLEAWLRDPTAQECLHVVATGTVVVPGLRPDADPANPGPFDTWQAAEADRRRLLQMLAQHVPGRFLLLSGDYHVSGAVLLKQRGHTVGAALVVPPLYAPLSYANATPEAVLERESIALEGGVLDVEPVPEGGRFARGSGWGLLRVAPVADGWSVGFRRDLHVWERGEAAGPLACEILLPGRPQDGIAVAGEMVQA